MTTITAAPTILENVEQIAPEIRAHAEESERIRRLATPTVEALRGAGLFRLLIPASLGGLEVDLLTHFRAVEAVARADGSAGWCLFINGGAPFSGVYLPDSAAEEIFGDPDTIMAGTVFPFGRAAVNGSGFSVTGRWPFASGCQHSSWLLAFCNVVDNGELRLGPGGAPEVRVVHYPTARATIHDTWDTHGLCGTGSHDVEVRDEPVPSGFTWGPGVDVTAGKHFSGPLYRVPFMSTFSWPMAAVALGIAQAAIDEVRALAREKRPAGQTAALSERGLFHRQLADAIASVSSARAWLHARIDHHWQQAVDGHRAPLPDRAETLLAAAHATRSAAHAVDTIYTAAGGTAVYRKSPLQRALRDIHALTQHVGTSPGQVEAAGAMLAGNAPPNPMILL